MKSAIELEKTSAKRLAVELVKNQVATFYGVHWPFVLLKSGGWIHEPKLGRYGEWDLHIDGLEIRIYPVENPREHADNNAIRFALWHWDKEYKDDVYLTSNYELYKINVLLNAYYMYIGNEQYT